MTDRTKQPDIVTPDTGNIALPERVELRGGIPVYLLGSGTPDLLRLEFIFRAGQAMEERHLAASSANSMLTEGTISYDAMTLNDLIDSTGAVLNHSSDKDYASLVVITLERKLDEVLSLAGEVLFAPSFPEKEFRMMMERRMQSFLTNRQNTGVIAREEFYRALFGNDNPYGRVTLAEDYGLITPETARRFHESFYTPGNMFITVAGKDPEKTIPVLEKYFSCPGGKKWSPAPFPDLSLKRTAPAHIFAEVKDSVQSSIRIGWPGLTRDHSDFMSLQVANVILGGYFGSRLMKNIREDKGYTYGISSVAGTLHHAGYITIITEVANKYRDQTIEEIKNEITILTREEPDENELTLVRNHFMGEIARMFDGPFASAETIRNTIDSNTGPDYYRQLEETVKTITPGKIKEIFGTYYNIDNAIEIIAGAG